LYAELKTQCLSFVRIVHVQTETALVVAGVTIMTVHPDVCFRRVSAIFYLLPVHAGFYFAAQG